MLRRQQQIAEAQQAATAAAANGSDDVRGTAPPAHIAPIQRRRHRDVAGAHQPRRNTVAVLASDWEEVMRGPGAHFFGHAPPAPAFAQHSRSSECLLTQPQPPPPPLNRAARFDTRAPAAGDVGAPAPLPQPPAQLPKLRVRRVRPRAQTTTNLIELPPDASAAPQLPQSVPASSSPPHSSRGPEFIRNASAAVAVGFDVDLTDARTAPAERRDVGVRLLDGRMLRVRCHAQQTTAGEVFEAVVRSERMTENYVLGVCALLGGDFVFVPPEVRLRKVAPAAWRTAAEAVREGREAGGGLLTLYVRMRFLMPVQRQLG